MNRGLEHWYALSARGRVGVWLLLTLSLLLLSGWSVVSPAWSALGYVSLFSMLIGFIFWYKGLARGGIAAVGQLQLLQPFLGLGLSATLLHERVSPLMLFITLGVILCVIASRKYAR